MTFSIHSPRTERLTLLSVYLCPIKGSVKLRFVCLILRVFTPNAQRLNKIFRIDARLVF
jgi:hypothetical protein